MTRNRHVSSAARAAVSTLLHAGEGGFNSVKHGLLEPPLPPVWMLGAAAAAAVGVLCQTEVTARFTLIYKLYHQRACVCACVSETDGWWLRDPVCEAGSSSSGPAESGSVGCNLTKSPHVCHHH